MKENSCIVEKVDCLLFDYVAKLEDGTKFDTISKEKAVEAGIYDKEKEYNPLFFKVVTDQILKSIGKGAGYSFSGTNKVDCKVGDVKWKRKRK